MKVGIIFRSYAKEVGLVPEVVKRAVLSAQKSSELRVGTDVLFEKVLILVPVDYDCGETGSRIRTALEQSRVTAEVLEVSGHHSSKALNFGIRCLYDIGFDYVVIMSNKALEYLKFTVMKGVLSALDVGNKVVGVRINELDDVHAVPIENTFCAWDIHALLSVDGFDSKIGVEEIAPIIRLTRKFGVCTKLISPQTEAKLNIRESTDGKVRHKDVKDTKRERQEAEAIRLGATIEWVLQHIF